MASIGCRVAAIPCGGRKGGIRIHTIRPRLGLVTPLQQASRRHRGCHVAGFDRPPYKPRQLLCAAVGRQPAEPALLQALQAAKAQQAQRAALFAHALPPAGAHLAQRACKAGAMPRRGQHQSQHLWLQLRPARALQAAAVLRRRAGSSWLHGRLRADVCRARESGRRGCSCGAG
jgi:hypothetical protein